MGQAQAVDALGADVEAGLAQQLVGEQAAAHADLAMDAPDRELDALGVERILPRQHMLIHAVDQRAVEIEQIDRVDAHKASPRVLQAAGHFDVPSASVLGWCGLLRRWSRGRRCDVGHRVLQRAELLVECFDLVGQSLGLGTLGYQEILHRLQLIDGLLLRRSQRLGRLDEIVGRLRARRRRNGGGRRGRAVGAAGSQDRPADGDQDHGRADNRDLLPLKPRELLR